MSRVIPGIYRHFKGGRYKVAGEAVHTETGERLVIYSSLASNAIFARPLDDFCSEVDKAKYPEAKQKLRFERERP